VAADASDSVPARTLLAAALGFAIAILMIWLLPFRLRLRVMVAVRRACPHRPSLDDTTRLAAAVGRMARRHHGWADCLEQSTATFFAGALLGAAPRWCIGAETVGSIQHAWVGSADGVAVDHAESGLSPVAMLEI
jgi:hypothetical protein